jgi:hypothetical protein
VHTISYLNLYRISAIVNNYSGDPNTGHSYSGYIRKPDKLGSGFRMFVRHFVFLTTSLDRFIIKKNIYDHFINKTVRLVDHLKTGHICPVFQWLSAILSLHLSITVLDIFNH